MDYQEAINTLKDEIKCSCYRNRGYCGICTIYSEMDRNNIIDACKTAISAMQEMQEYRRLGTLEEIKLLKETHLTGVELAQISCAIKQLAEYERIGTLEEVRDAVERQRPRKAILKNGKSGMFVDYADGHGEYKVTKWQDWCCPVCGWFVGQRYNASQSKNHDQRKSKYCNECGTKIDWSEEE